MALPIRTTVDDVRDLCVYFAKKPTGATIKEAKSVLDANRLDPRKMSAMKAWGLLEQEGEKYKATESGRQYAKGNEDRRAEILLASVMRIAPYRAIVERASHRKETSVTATDVAAHWHEHFSAEVAGSDKVLNDQAVCFFQLASGAALGALVLGRKGAPTRFEFDPAAIARIADEEIPLVVDQAEGDNAAEPSTTPIPSSGTGNGAEGQQSTATTGQGIFIAHGKNKRPLEQLKKILDQFRVPYKVAVDEPNLGRPISQKVRETMTGCNCAILIFTADEEFQSSNGETIWRPSENVVYELGAAGFLYDKRIVIMKENDVTFPANFSDLGHIAFGRDQLEAKAMDILKELIGFGIVKVST